jgi:hypothetical protein
MRRMLSALTLLIAAGGVAEAGSCKDEVHAALERQRKSSAFRMETKMLAPEGIVNMTVDYVLPDRMRQVISSTADPEPVETVRVGPYAWTRRKGQPWIPLNPQLTGELISQMEDTVGDNPVALGDFECLGKKPLGDKQMLAYRGENEKGGPKDMSPGAKDAPKLPNRPVRVIYVDPITGLPKRSIFARADKLDKPIFEASYSYPADIKIEAPKPPKKATSQ